MFCLSKALGAAGRASMVAGPAPRLIGQRAALLRKRLGRRHAAGGRAGPAGRALIAFEKATRTRLSEDHANARFLAEGRGPLHGVELDPRKGRHQHRG